MLQEELPPIELEHLESFEESAHGETDYVRTFPGIQAHGGYVILSFNEDVPYIGIELKIPGTLDPLKGPSIMDETEAWIDGKSELTCDECRGKGTVPFTPMQVEVLTNYEIKIICGRATYWFDLKNRNISSNGRPYTRKSSPKSPPLNLPPNWTMEDVLIEICRINGREDDTN